jgi:uroporphyrinogen decarboxylase
MTARERVLKAMAFEETDRVPMDLGGMPSTCISCFAYPRLVAELGLPPRRPRVYDTGQMLALPDLDVLDALDCDVVTADLVVSNAYDNPALWKPFDFGGRLSALVREPERFTVLPDGTVSQAPGPSLMPPQSHVFESEHGGQPLVFDGELPKPDLDALRREGKRSQPTDAQVRAAAEHLRRVRESTDRAVLFCGPSAGLGIANFSGLAIFPMLCLTEPDFVHELHEIVIEDAIARMQAYLSEVHPFIDVYQCCSDDWGTQQSTIAAPETFHELFLPYYRRFTDAIHAVAPNVKTFLHSCGAIYDILDDVVESGFNVLNPVQWTAGGHSYREWKDKCRGRIALWGGGVNAQETLPLGTQEDVAREAAEITRYMRQDGGFVFNSIHNILAEVPPKNVVAMYRAAAEA